MRLTMEFDENPRATYDSRGEGDVVFVRICPKCSRFVKADPTVTMAGSVMQPEGTNATCSQCGRVAMPLEGYF